MSNEEFIKRLLSPDRMEGADPFVVLSFCPINVHDTVADIGCGPGYFTIPLAKFLVSGSVHALDREPDMVAACRDRIQQARLGNVQVQQCSDLEFPIPQGSLDGAFLAFVVHENSDQVQFLKAVRELVQPKGWCTVLEWHRKPTEQGPPLESRLEPGRLQDLAAQAGFSYRDHRDLNGEQYMMTLRNP